MAAIDVTLDNADTNDIVNGGRVLVRNSAGVPYVITRNISDSSIDIWKGYSVSDEYVTDPLHAFNLYSGSLFLGAAQAFTGDGNSIVACEFMLSMVGSLVGWVYAELYEITGTYGTDAKPTGSAIATSDAFIIPSIPATKEMCLFEFSTPYATTAGAKYCIAIKYSDGNVSNYINVYRDQTTNTHDGNDSRYYSGAWSIWNDGDLVFRIYTNNPLPSYFSEQDIANKPTGTNYGAVSAAIDSDDIIHIAYMSDAGKASPLLYATFRADGTNDDWLTTDVSLVGDIGEDPTAITNLYTAIAIDSADVPHITFTRVVKISGAVTFTLSYINKVSGTWGTVYDVHRTQSYNCSRVALSIDYDNIPVVAYRAEPTVGEHLNVAIGNGNNATSFTTHLLHAASVGLGQSIAVDSSGNHWVAYILDSAYVYIRMHVRGEAWSTWGTQATNSNVGVEPSLFINGTDVYVFYENDANEIAYDMYDGSTWAGETVLDDAANYNNVKVAWASMVHNDSTGPIITVTIPVYNYYVNMSDFGPVDSNTKWTNDAKGFDGLTGAGDYADYSNNPTSATDLLTGFGTNAPIRGGSVNKVEMRAYVAGDGNIPCKVAVYSSGDKLGDETFTPATADWTAYSDLTIPTGGWTWEIIGALEGRFYPDSDGLQGDLEAYKIELRVTCLAVTPSAAAEISYVFVDESSPYDIWFNVLELGGGGTETPQSVAGTLTFTGVIAIGPRKVVLGSLTSVGTTATIGLFFRTYLGSLTSSGVIVRDTFKFCAGALTSSGAVATALMYMWAVAGALTSAGTAVKKTALSYTGSLTSSGIVTTIGSFLRTLSGSLSASGALVKQTTATFAGTFTSSGILAVAKAFLRAFSGTLTGAGTAIKQTSVSYVGALATSGIVTTISTFFRALAGVLTSAGILVKQTSASFAGTVTGAGVVTALSIFYRALAGAVSSAGIVVKQTALAYTGALTSAGDVVRHIGTSLAGEVTSSGAIVKKMLVSLVGTMASSGVLESIKSVLISLEGTLTSTGTLAGLSLKRLLGTVTNSGLLIKMSLKSFAGTVSSSSALVTLKALSISVAGALTSAGSVTKRAGVSFTGVLSNTGDVVRQIRTSLAGGVTSSGSIVKKMLVSLVGTMASSGVLESIKSVLISLTGTLASAGTLTRLISSNLAGSLPNSGTVIKQFSTSLVGVLSKTGVVIKKASVTFDVVLASAGSLAKQLIVGTEEFYQSIAGTLASVGVIVKDTSLPFAGTITSTGTVTKRMFFSFVGALPSSGAIHRSIAIALAGSIILVGTFIKEMLLSLGGVLSSAGSLAKQLVVGTEEFYQSVAGSLVSSGVVTSIPIKVILGTLSVVGTISKDIAVSYAGMLSTIGIQAKDLILSLSGTITSTGTITKGIFLSFAGTLPNSGAIHRSISVALAGAITFIGTSVKLSYSALVGVLGIAGGIATYFNPIILYRTLTLQVRNFSLTLQERSFGLVLRSRKFVFTLFDRKFVFTLFDRDFVFTLFDRDFE